MKMSLRAAALAMSLLAAGCLPRGQAPVGQRWLASRTVEQVLFAPGPDGESARLLTTRRSVGADLTTDDVFVVSAPAGGATFGAERLLLDHVSAAWENCFDRACAPTDSRGRLLLPRDATKVSMTGQVGRDASLVRVDPLTGDKVDLGQGTYLVGVSPDRTAFAYWNDRTFVLREVDDREVRLDEAEDGRLAGGVVYILADGTLAQLRPPYDTREELARDVDYFVVFPAGESLLGLCRRLPDSNCRSSLLEPSTGDETPLPAEFVQPANLSMSPSRRYLFGFAAPSADGSTQVSLYDRQTATSQSTTVAGALSSGEGAWRPAHDEIWFTTDAFSPGQDSPADPSSQAPPRISYWRWRPGEAPVKVGDAPPFTPIGSFGVPPDSSATWPFTPDGRFWLSYDPNASQGDKPPVLLRAVDDAAAAPLPLDPAGTAVQNVWPLADGRLIVEDRITNEKRCDIYLVDPVARTTRKLGHGGNVVATGATRILVFLDWLIGGGSGELTLIDLETGAPTLLAENVHAVAVEKAASGADALAPGTRIAYVSRHRIESPYDGLWVALLP
jgi:hypothetical protein